MSLSPVTHSKLYPFYHKLIKLIDMHLEPKEKIVVENGVLGSRSRLTLTNKRLIFEEGSGYFLSSWKQFHTVPLDAIEEAFVDRDGFILDTIKLKMKDGPIMKIKFQIKDIFRSDSFSERSPERFAIAINHCLSVLPN